MTEYRGGSGNLVEDREKASDAGCKGGQCSGDNLRNDPQHVSKASKKGDQQSGGNRSGKS